MKPHQMIARNIYHLFLLTLCLLTVPLITAAQGRIVFSSGPPSSPDLYLMNPDGSNQLPLNVDRLLYFSSPSFSRDGLKIAFISEIGASRHVIVMKADGTNPVNLTHFLSGAASNPSLNTTGSKVVFAANYAGNQDIFLLDTDGTDTQADWLTQDPANDREPTFSPDGSKIAFVSDRAGVTEIYIMNADGSNQTRLTFLAPFYAAVPAFSPDGTKIAFASDKDGNREIYMMNADGTNIQRLTNDPGYDDFPSFSSDGSKIAFFSNREDGNQIWVMDVSGANPTRITFNEGDNVFPSWGGYQTGPNPPSLSNVAVVTPIFEGTSTTLSANISSPNVGDSFVLTVNWGDGSPTQVFNYPAGTTSFTETHQYADDEPTGTPYAVSLMLTSGGGSDSRAAFVSVENVAPTLSVIQPAPQVVGSPLTLSASVSDPGTLDTHTVQINWGDGQPPTTLNLAAGVTDFAANHTYAAPGAYSINVSASDNDGGVANPVSVLVGVVPPPTLGKIAFTSNRSGNNEIWLMDSNGTNPVRLTNNPADDNNPDLSRDGSKIAFVSNRDGNPEIYIMNAAGSFQTRLTNNTAQDHEPVFSPDGSKIAFTSNRDGNYEVYLMNSDGTNQTRLTTNAQDDGQPTFSPDGTKIYFVRLAANQSDAHIYSMDLNGANQTPLTSGSFVLNGQPNSSPDGQKIVFASVRPLSGFTESEILVMDANGANQVRLTTVAGHDLEPVFSPDGTKIAFRSERDGNPEIYIMDANGANQQRITFDGVGVSNFAPSWAAVPTVSVDIPDNLAAEQDATLTVPINVTDTNGKGIISYDFALNYDPAVLEPQSMAFDKTGTLSANFEVSAGTGTPGRVVISAFGTAALSGAGTLLILKFNVIGTPPTSSDLILNPFMFNEGIPFADVAGGRVFVQGTIRGAVLYGTSATPVGVPNVLLAASGDPETSATTGSDGTYVLGGFGPGFYTVMPFKTGDNGGISALDASLVSQFLVGLIPLTNNQQAAGEVSGNGTLTSFDAALIAQYVVGLPNTDQTGTWRFLPPSRNYAMVGNLTGENYTAILMGEVSGNWASTFAASLSSLKEVESTGVISSVESNSRETQGGRGPAVLATATLPSVKVSPNQSITIPVTLKFSGAAPPVRAYQFDLIYDPLVIQPEAVPTETADTLSSGLAAVVNSTQPGRLRLAAYGTNSISTNGTLVNLKFLVVGAAGSSSTLSFNGLMFNEGNPAAEGKNGKVTVKR